MSAPSPATDPATHDLWSTSHTPTCGHKHRQIPVPPSFTAQPLITNLEELLPTLQRDGFVVVPSVLPPHLLLAAQAASKYLIGKARDGTFWPYVRTVGQQHPPWPVVNVAANKTAARERDRMTREQRREQQRVSTSTNTSLNTAVPPTPDSINHTNGHENSSAPSIPNIWGIQYLLHPSLEYLRTVYAEIYFLDSLIEITRRLLADPAGPSTLISEDELLLGQLDLLISPARNETYELEWHRDEVSLSAPDSSNDKTVKEGEGSRCTSIEYQIALFADSSLYLLPGSHIHPRSKRDTGGYEARKGQITIELQPGDAVFYDPEILRRAVMTGINAEKELGRMTLLGNVGYAAQTNPEANEKTRAWAREMRLRSGLGEEMDQQASVGEGTEVEEAVGVENQEGEGFGLEDEKKRERAAGMRRRLIGLLTDE